MKCCAGSCTCYMYMQVRVLARAPRAQTVAHSCRCQQPRPRALGTPVGPLEPRAPRRGRRVQRERAHRRVRPTREREPRSLYGAVIRAGERKVCSSAGERNERGDERPLLAGVRQHHGEACHARAAPVLHHCSHDIFLSVFWPRRDPARPVSRIPAVRSAPAPMRPSRRCDGWAVRPCEQRNRPRSRRRRRRRAPTAPSFRPKKPTKTNLRLHNRPLEPGMI